MSLVHEPINRALGERFHSVSGAGGAIRPVEQIGHTLLGRFRVKRYRGDRCEGSTFVADLLPQSRYAAMGVGFGGGDAKGTFNQNVILELIPSSCIRSLPQLDELNAGLPHPHLLRCLEVGAIGDGELAGTLFTVWEMWKTTLAEAIARRPLMDESEIHNLAIGIAKGLARYHSENRTHGDVRAERICLVDGQWKLAPVLGPTVDKDKAKIANDSATHDDIYALGLVILACLTGCRPTAELHSERQAEIEQLLAEVPEFWRHWLRRCLSQDPHQRCTAVELALIDAEIPASVGPISVERSGEEYRLQWAPVDRERVQVYRWLNGKCPVQDEIWLLPDVERVTETISLDTPTTARIRLQSGETCSVIVTTVVGNVALISDIITLTWAADVQRLCVSVEGNSLVATWDWPEGACLAEVKVSNTAFAKGVDDPEPASSRCFRSGYMADGRFTLPIKQRTGQIYVTVIARHRHEHGWECASGRTSGARAVMSFIPHVRLDYRVKKVSLLAWMLFNSGPWRVQMRVDRSARLPDLRLEASRDGRCSNADKELFVLRIRSRNYQRGSIVQVDFQPPADMTIDNWRLVVHDKSCSWLRLVRECD